MGKHHGSEGRKGVQDPPNRTLNVPSGSDRKDFNHSPNCRQNASAGWVNTMAVKNGKARKIHQTGCLMSLLDPTEKLSITAQTAAKTHLLDWKTPWQ